MTRGGNDGVLEQADALVSLEEAGGILARHWGLEGRLERLSGERDQNFRLSAADGDVILKISNSAETDPVSDLQSALLIHLERVAPDLPVPRLLPTRSGETRLRWRRQGGSSAFVKAITAVGGAPLRARGLSSDEVERLGADFARLDAALADFRHPGEDHVLAWDLQHVDRLMPWTTAIDDLPVRRLAVAALEEAARAVAGLRSGPFQAIHNDLNPDNVFVAGAPARLSGVIDFGDAVRAPRIQDLAVAASYHLRPEGEPLARVGALVRGYHRDRPLADAEFDALPRLITGRLAMTVTISSWRARRHPGNREYILRNQASAIAGLRRLAGDTPQSLTDRLRAACAGSGE